MRNEVTIAENKAACEFWINPSTQCALPGADSRKGVKGPNPRSISIASLRQTVEKFYYKWARPLRGHHRIYLLVHNGANQSPSEEKAMH